MFRHTVLFWLRDDLSPEEEGEFEAGLRSLTAIDLVRGSLVGTPAGTDREVVDNSFDLALHLDFEDADDQDAYQAHPVHREFVEDCEAYWERVQVYDSLEL